MEGSSFAADSLKDFAWNACRTDSSCLEELYNGQSVGWWSLQCRNQEMVHRDVEALEGSPVLVRRGQGGCRRASWS